MCRVTEFGVRGGCVLNTADKRLQSPVNLQLQRSVRVRALSLNNQA